MAGEARPGSEVVLSFIIPAHNEEAEIAATVRAVFAAAAATGAAFEVIVVDDASTDATAEIARREGAAVLSASLRKIAAVRNAGARSARADRLFFVDADTRVTPEAVRAAMRALDAGAIGGGARVRIGDEIPRWARVSWAILGSGIIYWMNYACGCFFFARRDAFEAAGGFPEAYFASEEVHLGRTLKKRGRFVVVPECVLTSGRKFRIFGWREFLRQMVALTADVWLSRGLGPLRSPDTLGFWYDGRRERGVVLPGQPEPPGSARRAPDPDLPNL